MRKYEDDTHNCTNEQLANMVREIARRHVDQDKETLLEAANRIEARRFEKHSEDYFGECY